MNQWTVCLVLMMGWWFVGCGDDSSGSNNDNLNNNQSGSCGDGQLDPGEACDDGTANSDTLPDTCRTDCRSPYCGDGVVDADEDCEGEPSPGDDCAAHGFEGGELGCAASCERDFSQCHGWLELSAGEAHTCGLRPDGTVRCWGRNEYGQLGSEEAPSGPTPVEVDLQGVDSIGVGWQFSCAVVSGQVWCWGINTNGQLGPDGPPKSSAAPILIPLPDDAVQVSGGASHACAVMATDGGVHCWGEGEGGELGDGNETDSVTPVAVSGLTGVRQLACTWAWCAVVRDDGTAWSWGPEEWFRLGNGAAGDAPTPTQIVGITNARSIDINRHHGCLVTEDDTVFCWGIGDDGRLGTGDDNWRDVPAPVVDSGGVPVSDAVAVALGTHFSCVLRLDGRVWCWGANENAGLGDSTTTGSFSPVRVANLTEVARITAGRHHACAATTAGAAWCWGYSGDGEVGPGVTFDPNVPVQSVVGGVQELVTGWWHACARLNNGTVNCWGDNRFGQLGDGSTLRSADPVAAFGMQSIVSVGAGQQHSCAVDGAGGAWCWGTGTDGRLGTGSNNSSLQPVALDQIPLGGRVLVRVAAGGTHSCGLADDNTVWCWGNGANGRLGQGGTTSSNVPVPVSGLADIAQISLGTAHSCAVDTSGIGWCWGDGGWGVLGSGDANDAQTPVPIDTASGLPALAQVDAGDTHTCAAGTDGSLWCWGVDWNDKLGNGLLGNSLVPSPVVDDLAAPLTDGVSMAAGDLHSCGLLDEGVGTVYCWGMNFRGQLGYGESGGSPTPQLFLSVIDAQTISAGVDFSCVLETDGTVWCSGSNSHGQSSTGSFASTLAPVPIVP